MRGLDLFSGIGGLTKALEGYIIPIAYCENDRYAQGVLLSRMWSGDLPWAPIADDVCQLRGVDFISPIDIIYGGFPCQDISVAGRGEGLEGKRSGLFFEIVRLVGELRPQFVFLENVSAITVRGSERVIGELCKLGYDCRWGVLSAYDVGAPHQRDRWWLLAHAKGDGSQGGIFKQGQVPVLGGNGDTQSLADATCNTGRISDRNGKENVSECADMADAPSPIGARLPIGTQSPHAKLGIPSDELAQPADVRQIQRKRQSCERRIGPEQQTIPAAGIGGGVSDTVKQSVAGPKKRRSKRQKSDPFGTAWWETEPDVGRVANGVPFRVERLHGLGNAVVPSCAREAFKRLMGFK